MWRTYPINTNKLFLKERNMAVWGSEEKNGNVDSHEDVFVVPAQSGFEDDFDPNFHHSQMESTEDSIVSKEENSSPQWPSQEESNKYIASLEARLRQMKGNKGLQLTSKEMLKTLEDSKMDHMRHLVGGDESVQGAYISALLPDEEVMSPGCFSVSGTSMKRKLFPEQPLTVAEMEGLLDLDAEEAEEGEKTSHTDGDKGGER